MKSTSQRQPIRKAFALSMCINGLMVALGTLAGLVKPLSMLTVVSDAIAWPPGHLIGWMVRPKTHDIKAYIFAAVAGVIISILFYAALSWIVLRLVEYLRSSRGEQEA
jgi:hypothetical protein